MQVPEEVKKEELKQLQEPPKKTDNLLEEIKSMKIEEPPLKDQKIKPINTKKRKQKLFFVLILTSIINIICFAALLLW